MSQSSPELIDIMILIDEVKDLIDETPVQSCTLTEIDATITRLEHQRSALRRKSLEIGSEENDDVLKMSVNNVIMSIKDYIKDAKDFKCKLNMAQTTQDIDAAACKERSITFAIDEIQRNIAEFEVQFGEDPSQISDIELMQLKKQNSTLPNRLSKIAEKLENILKLPIRKAETLYAVKDIEKKYVMLNNLKNDFMHSVNNEVASRKLDKDLHYNKSHLNIKLDKYCGFESSTDFYSFRDDFEKIYLQSTPTKFLPDLLKNNFLAEPALTLVRSINNIDDIWSRLKAAYGDTKILLTKKLQTLTRCDLAKSRDPEKLAYAISTFINILRETIQLAQKHKIEANLYYGDSLSKIYQQLGDWRLTRFLTIIADDEPNEKETWRRLLIFLEKEEKLQQQKSLINGCKNNNKDGTSNSTKEKRIRESYYGHGSHTNDDPHCFICGESSGYSEHLASNGPGETRVVQYFTCKIFAEKTPAARLALLKDKGFCAQCLLPGADATQGKHHEGKCQHEYICPHPTHKRHPAKRHVLVCDDHKDSTENQEVLQKFKTRCMKSPRLPDFSRQIKLSFHSESSYAVKLSSNDSVINRGVYLLQAIQINGHQLNIFYDNGCSDFILSRNAAKLLGSRAEKQNGDPIQLGGVGNCSIKSRGSYNVKLPLFNGKVITLSGICLDQITSNFPIYPLKDVEEDIYNHYNSTEGTDQLPKLPSTVGGEVHLMIGVKYLRYHPRLVHQLPTGLTLYESAFRSPNGERGVVGGPHKVFTDVHKNFFNSANESSFLGDCWKQLKNDVQQKSDVPLLGYTESKITQLTDGCPTQSNLSKLQRIFEEVESTGSEISYRCPTCRSCKSCKHHEEYEAISLKEEVEQEIINSSVNIDLENSTTTASLPFIANPMQRLAPNKDRAMKVFHQQLQKLNKPSNRQDKEDIIKSEQKLQDLGFVEYTRNLPANVQLMLQSSPVQYYIPWRAVWKGNSVSTPCRVVYDASQATASGYSLNDILAKGRNNLNKLQEILVRWSMHRVAVHTDIRKMYNTVRLVQGDWCYQRYIWEPDLDPTKIPDEKIIKTLIYGVRSSGNQAEYGLRKVAELAQEEYPKVKQIIHKDVYVDDCVTGEENIDLAHQRADEIELVLNRGGFHLKGVCFSGEDPPEVLTDDGETIFVGGLKWFPKTDQLSINIGDLNFAKKCRGKKPISEINIIPSKLTRRHCSSKVAEVFDLTGKVAPITASLKMDLQQLVHRKLDWDDTIPDDLRPLWESNFELIKSIGTLRFNRAIIPDDAVNLNLDTLDFGDASQSMVCTCVYARFKRRNGEYSCQLVFARSRVVPHGMSMPRAELYAALINAYSGEVVRRSFKDFHQHAIKLTDSQISLHWISNDEKPLKQWTRNRVIEIQRFTRKEQWMYVRSNDMIADIGTRRGVMLQEVNQHSTWVNGFPWMKLESSKFPMLTSDEIKLNESDVKEFKKEVDAHLVKKVEISKDRFAFSDYLVNPNQWSFSKVIRILAYIIRFCQRIKTYKKHQNQSIKQSNKSELPQLAAEDLKAAENYFFQKGTREVHQFVPSKRYEKFTTMKGVLLMYTGRILPEDEVSIVGRYTLAMKDLAQHSFCVPVLDHQSPIACSLALDVHWNHPVAKHSGVETTLRFIMQKAFIMEGRSLVKTIRKNCKRCRYLNKKSIESIMGPVSNSQITVAPAFYATQVDLSGPYQAYSPLHKRTTIKIWLTVFCCCATSAVGIKVMDDYSSDAFIMSFTRFASNYGFPKQLFCDSGSQLVKGCETMKLNFQDLQYQLNKRVAVDFQICPVGGHNMNGKVERKIREINLSIQKNAHNQRLSLMQWETLSAVIANNINDLPIAVGSKIDVENMDLITPNRLLLGRNNSRSPTGDMVVCDSPSKLMKENLKIYNAWFESWLLNHVPKLMEQRKWFEGDNNLQVGDIVLFTKVDSVISSTYQYGMITEVEASKDGVIRKVRVKYQNSNENTPRETYRSVRNLVLIRSVEEVEFAEEFYKANC